MTETQLFNVIELTVVVDSVNQPIWIVDFLKLLEKYKKYKIKNLIVINSFKQSNITIKSTVEIIIDKIVEIDKKLFKRKFDVFEKKSLTDSFPKVNLIKDDIHKTIKQIEEDRIKICKNYFLPIGISTEIVNKHITKNLIIIPELTNQLSFIKYIGIQNIISVISEEETYKSEIESNFLNYISIEKLLPINLGLNNIFGKYAIILARELSKGNVNINSKHYFLKHENLKLIAIFNLIWIQIKYIIKNSISSRIFLTQWFLLFSKDSINNIKDTSNFEPIEPDKSVFWADPFIIKEGSKNYIIFEEYSYSKKKAHISAGLLNSNGNLSNIKIILDKKYHLSFPFTFKVNNDWYMIPESMDNKTIELYKAEKLPYKWNFVKNLMENISAVDTNLFYYKNKWWMFTTIKDLDYLSPYDELWIFYNESFDSNSWVSHPSNPVKTSIESSRPAGKIYINNNKILRPTQNSLLRYGHKIWINEIVTLSENEYEEIFMKEININEKTNYLGIHTLNFNEDYIISDSKKRTLRFF